MSASAAPAFLFPSSHPLPAFLYAFLSPAQQQQFSIHDLIAPPSDSQSSSFESELASSESPNFHLWWHFLSYFHYPSEEFPKNPQDPHSFPLLKHQIQRFSLYQRALQDFPGSYKLWYHYLYEFYFLFHRRPLTSPGPSAGPAGPSQGEEKKIRGKQENTLFLLPIPLDHPIYSYFSQECHRCLLSLYKMPKIWYLFLSHLVETVNYQEIHQLFNDSLRSLAITQHSYWIWPLYLEWIEIVNIPSLSISVYERFLLIHPEKEEIYIDFLIHNHQYHMAMIELMKIIDISSSSSSSSSSSFSSIYGRSLYDLWKMVLEIIENHPKEINPKRNQQQQQQQRKGKSTVKATDRMDDSSSDSSSLSWVDELDSSYFPYIDIESLIEHGISRFPTESSFFSLTLIHYYTHLGLFHLSIQYYEESIERVKTIKDFTILYDHYSRFLEHYIELMMDSSSSEDSMPISSSSSSPDDELEVFMLRLENLLQRRDFLLNTVHLRQNPYSIKHWESRFQHFSSDYEGKHQEYEKAIKTLLSVDISRIDGKFYQFWCHYARFMMEYKLIQEDEEEEKEEGKDDRKEDFHSKSAEEKRLNRALESSRGIYRRAIEIPYQSLDHLVYIYQDWIENELRCGKYEEAREILRKACEKPILMGKENPSQIAGGEEGNSSSSSSSLTTVQSRLYRSSRLWGLRVDIEENFSTFPFIRSIYQEILSLHVATPQLILHYGQFLIENHYYEESYRLYEESMKLFSFPSNFPILLAYLQGFLDRFSSLFPLPSSIAFSSSSSSSSSRDKNLFLQYERVRELFDSILLEIPTDSREYRWISLYYGKYEENYGNFQRALSIYQRAIEKSKPEQRMELYFILISRVSQRLGQLAAREYYEKALRDLPDKDLRRFLLQFIHYEWKFGEFPRCRSLFQWGAQFIDPRLESSNRYYHQWSEFEISHGTEASFKEMLRIKRTIEQKFSLNSVVIENLIHSRDEKQRKLNSLFSGINMENSASSSSAVISSTMTGQKRKHEEFSSSSVTADGEEKSEEPAKKQAINPEEISIDED